MNSHGYNWLHFFSKLKIFSTVSLVDCRGPSSAESPEALKRRLMELPEVEPHHICITGSRAKDVAQKWLFLESKGCF